ncbi:type II CRISPR-associated endonuclease Cas1 [Mycoplasma sp. NEAQ87857]|uniref:type II CRISPR-associated endonuclease Cas1 n=1 Tax=Mycoplasma sp. NEAQ87857 TaxID=2683967 RepID=UPI00131826EB|nr:type II CRISPR-associated endonuclease Cas1 [Mycoplasma sp. NEAQ87857]QGZ97246.1 type II CRISPR-associated endonuclease Cas1 [Mycoplasma sp. NEAQ87857]
MPKKIVEISDSTYVSLFLNSLVVIKEGNKITIPINDIECLLFTNYQTTLSIPLINKLANNNTNIIICNSKYEPNAIISKINGYYDNKVFINQINWGNEFKGTMWKEIIKLKIINSTKLLHHLKLINDKDIDKLTSYWSSVKDYDITNREGHAAKLYFKNLFGDKFKRDDEKELKNKFLNYGYIVLMSFVARSIIKKGLDNRIGLFHKSYSNNFALACDLMEPFRCIVDQLVYQQFYLNEFCDFAEYKQEVYLMFLKNIIVNQKQIKLVDYIETIIQKLINNESIKDLYIEFN